MMSPSFGLPMAQIWARSQSALVLTVSPSMAPVFGWQTPEAPPSISCNNSSQRFARSLRCEEGRTGRAAAGPDVDILTPPLVEMFEGTRRMLDKTAVAKFGVASLLVTLAAVYANHFHNSFHFDDAHTIVDNAAIREPRNIPLFFRDATTFSALPSNQSYRPLVSTLLAIDYWLGHGLNPFWFHLSIFALFVALTLLIAFVTYRLIGNLWIALGAAALYGLH